jgi:hypothetical protein
VLRQFDALVPGQGSPQLLRERDNGGGDRIPDCLGSVSGKRWAILGSGASVLRRARQVQQHGERRGPFDRCPDSGALETKDEVALC